MFSKKWLSLVLLTLSVMSLGACSDFLRGPKKEDQVIEIGTGDLRCLEKAPQSLKGYVNDQSTESDIRFAMSCFRQALAEFVSYTKGDNPNLYTADELRHFFNRYLLKSQQISIDFMSEIMNIKSVMIGGSNQTLERSEITKLQDFLKLIEKIMIDLSGHIKLLMFKQDKAFVNEFKIAKVESQLSEAVKSLVTQTQITKSRYELDSFKRFLKEMALHLGAEGSDSALQIIQNWIPVVDKAKNLFLGHSSMLVSQQDWIRSSEWVVSAYVFALRYMYLAKDVDLDGPQNWRSFLKTLDRGVQLIESAPVLDQSNQFLAKDIDEVIEELWKLNLFKTKMSSDIIKNTYRRIIVHILEAPNAGRGNPNLVIGLNQNHLAVLKEEYLIWRTTQEFINQAFLQSEGYVTLKGLIEAARQYKLIEHVKELNVNQLQMEQLQRNWTDWIRILTQPKPILWNSDRRMLFNYNYQGVHLGFVGVSISNAMRSLTQLLLRGYSVQQSRHLFENSIPEESFIHFEEDFKEFGRAIKFLDPRTLSSARRTFKEGNFFTFKGNGDLYLDAIEAYELFSMLFSGGMNMAGELHRDLVSHGCHINRLDVFEREYLKDKCFFGYLNSKYEDYFNGMPWMTRYLKSINAQARLSFFQNVYFISKEDRGQKIPGTVEYSEIRTMTSIIQYVESLMLTYDRDRDGRLSEAEVVLALPRFKDFIIGLSPLKDWFVEDIFLYLVFEGKKPEGLKDMAGFKIKRMRGLGKIDRSQLIGVLAVLKQDASN